MRTLIAMLLLAAFSWIYAVQLSHVHHHEQHAGITTHKSTCAVCHMVHRHHYIDTGFVSWHCFLPPPQIAYYRQLQFDLYHTCCKIPTSRGPPAMLS